MAKTYLVTGGLGFIGASLTRGLVAQGHTVRVLDNSARGSKEKLGDMAKDIEIVEADIRDPAAVRRAVKGVDSVCHLAYVNGTEYFYKHPAFVLDVAVKGMVNVIDACIAHDVPELVLASSSEAYQTPPHVPTDESVPLVVPDILNPRYSYGGGKILAELMAVNYGREHFDRVLIFRPHNVYGPAMGYEHVIPQFIGRLSGLMKQGKGPHAFEIQGDGSQSRSFIFIDDFTAGLLTMIEKGEHLHVYHIGTMDEITIGDLAKKVAQSMGASIELASKPEPHGSTQRRCPDTTKLERLGWKPKISLEEGLKPTIEWYSAHPAPEGSGLKSAPSLFIP